MTLSNLVTALKRVKVLSEGDPEEHEEGMSLLQETIEELEESLEQQKKKVGK